MKILVLNSGSSSQKACLFDLAGKLPDAPPRPLWEGKIEWRENCAKLEVRTSSGVKAEQKLKRGERSVATAHLLQALLSGETRVLMGSALVWAQAALVLIMTGHWVKALMLLVSGAAVVGQVDVLVRPWVVGAHVKMLTLLVFFALLGGAKAFGILGIFIGPIVLSFALAVERPTLVSVSDNN